MLLIKPSCHGAGLGFTLLREGLERAGGLQLDIRTLTEGYYEQLGASRSLEFRAAADWRGLALCLPAVTSATHGHVTRNRFHAHPGQS